MVIIGKAIDLAVGNGEIFPLLGFDGQSIVVHIHAHTATEKRPAGEGAEGDDEKNDERCAFTRNGAWRDAAAGELAAIVAIGIAHWQDSKDEHADKKYNRGDCALSDQRAGHAKDSTENP